MTDPTTFMTNIEWSERKGYPVYLANSDANSYIDKHETPNATQLNSLRTDAFAMIERGIGSTGVAKTTWLTSLEYRLVEALRMYEVAIKRGELEFLLKAIDQLLTLIPNRVAQEISLPSQGSGQIRRGVSSG